MELVSDKDRKRLERHRSRWDQRERSDDRREDSRSKVCMHMVAEILLRRLRRFWFRIMWSFLKSRWNKPDSRSIWNICEEVVVLSLLEQSVFTVCRDSVSVIVALMTGMDTYRTCTASTQRAIRMGMGVGKKGIREKAYARRARNAARGLLCDSLILLFFGTG